MQPCAFAYHLYYMLYTSNTGGGINPASVDRANNHRLYIFQPVPYSTVSNYNLRFAFNRAFWKMICIFFAISSSMRRPGCNRMAWDHWPHD